MEKGKGETFSLKKCPTGINGLDEMTQGGLPRGRTTLVYGGPGCGKTVLAMEFLYRGIMNYQEPGVFLAFEEPQKSLVTNFASMGFHLSEAIDKGKLLIDFVKIDPAEITEAGDFNLDPVFIRLEQAIQKTGAKRVAIDTIETIFSALTKVEKLRSEIKRLFQWLSEKGMTAIVTGEEGRNEATKYGLEEYVSDCVIVLDNRIREQVSKRRLRILKYRGSSHIADECPFLISSNGFSVLPVTSLELNHPAGNERISTGVSDLDDLMSGLGYYRGSSILVSGTAGTGKSSIAAHFVEAACKRNERCLYLSFEESVDQIVRNMKSIKIDLSPYIENGLLTIKSERTSTLGLEEHLLKLHRLIEDQSPKVVIMDPITNFFSVGNFTEVKNMLTRILDFLKQHEITGFFTSLTEPDNSREQTTVGISSIMDTWIVSQDYQDKNEKKRILYLLKSRGMGHSRAIKEMHITPEGVKLTKPHFNLERDKLDDN
ncbi:MAG: circadian clock protein KaiC [Bacteroidales bacterium]|nr:circadian clock protein KaiC [Bacteroidales bacterium]